MISKFGTFEFALADRYRFEEELGRGAMGTVYRAQDVRLGRPVAVKMLHPLLTNEQGAQRFKAEIRIAAGLHHGNIIGVHESGEADGRLFYVMDYIGGETLRSRLNREKQLPVEDALQIVEQIAAALQYAHDHGVVHRDVKPENIILAGDRACLMDFGLARAFGEGAGSERLTASGFSVGTPHYLSPEQAAAEKDVGPKADQYSLACVLYEMLAGEPPFTGPTAAAIAMRHVSQEAAPIRTRRKTATLGVEAAISRAMEKVPADRFANTVEFVRGLKAHRDVVSEGITHPARPVKERDTGITRRRWAMVATALALVAAFLTLQSRSDFPIVDRVELLLADTLDKDNVLILSGTANTKIGQSYTDARLRNALHAWTDIQQPTERQIGELERTAPSKTQLEIGRAARKTHSGRFIIVNSRMFNDSINVDADLYDTRSPNVVSSHSITALSRASSLDTAIKRLAYALLFNNTGALSIGQTSVGTQSARAHRGFLAGMAALEVWNLLAADSSFAAALRYDPQYPQANLWLAQVRSFARENPPGIQQLVENALNNSASLSVNDRLYATALRDMGNSRLNDACRSYDSLAVLDGRSFAAWFGIAVCTMRDPMVLADQKAPHALKYRTSVRRAVDAMDRAFDMLPSIHGCCVSRMAVLLREMFAFINANHFRLGRGGPNGTDIFLAYPQLSNDTIAFVPLPAAAALGSPPASYPAAIEHERRRFMRVAQKRASLLPNNADALELLAFAMDMLDDPAAIDTIARARLYSVDVEQRVRLAVTETWIRLKHAGPGNSRELVRVQAIADSILKNTPRASTAVNAFLSTLAALLGRPQEAASLALASPVPDDGVTPSEVVNAGTAFLSFASLGGPNDSLRVVDARLASAISNVMTAEKRSLLRSTWQLRGARMIFPQFQSSYFEAPDTSTDLIAAQTAYRRGDFSSVRSHLLRIEKTRAGLRAADRTFDALLPEARLFLEVGDTVRAASVIGYPLAAISSMPAQRFLDLPNAGALVQSIALEARLLQYLGRKTEADRWAQTLQILQRR